MRRRWFWLGVLIVAAMACVPTAANSQAVLGIGGDALVLPRGTLRVRVVQSWTSFDERYGLNTPFRENGSLEPIALDFNRDSIGIAEFESLIPLRNGLRLLTGYPGYEVTLGKTVLDLRATVRATPIVAELGLTDRFSMSVVVPVVHTRTEANFVVNPAGREGNLGFNPAMEGSTNPARTENDALLAQFAAAANQLNQELAFCEANPNAGSCPTLNANRDNAQSLISSSQAFAGGIGQIYNGSQFVPITNSDADLAIKARVAALGNLYRSFGVTSISSTGPIGAPSQLSLADAQRILTDPLFDLGAQPIRTVQRHGIGDIELAGKLQFLNSLGIRTEDRLKPGPGVHFRSAVTAAVRLGTGEENSPDNFIDIGTGNGQTDIELRSQSDLLWGSHFWASLAGRYGWQLKDREVVRVTPADRPIAALYRRREVQRDLGDYYELEVTPRYVINDYMGFSGQYLYRRKIEDRYSGTFTTTNLLGETVTLDPSILDKETSLREHRLTVGLVFSSVSAYTRGKARVPFEVSYQHSESVKGYGGKTPRLKQDMIQLRVYTRLFGNR